MTFLLILLSTLAKFFLFIWINLTVFHMFISFMQEIRLQIEQRFTLGTKMSDYANIAKQ